MIVPKNNVIWFLLFHVYFICALERWSSNNKPKYVNIQCLRGSIFICFEKDCLFLRYLWAISYYIRYAKVLVKTFLGRFSSGAHTFQIVPKHVWVWHCTTTRGSFGKTCVTVACKKGLEYDLESMKKIF